MARGRGRPRKARTPPIEPHEDETEHPTPSRARLQAEVAFRDRYNLPVTNEQIFADNNISRRTGYRLLSTQTRRPNHDPNYR